MKAVIFDMDGTLVDSEALAFQSAEDGLREYWRRRGQEPRIPARAELRSLVGLPSLEYFGRLLPDEHRRDAAEVRTRVAGEEVRRLAAGEGRLFPGVRETLAALRRRGWKLALVSNCGSTYFGANLEHLELRSIVDIAYCLDDLPSKPQNVEAALAHLGARDGFMVGDRRADLEAGRANGLRTVGCLYGFGTVEELAEADFRVARLNELLDLIE